MPTLVTSKNRVALQLEQLGLRLDCLEGPNGHAFAGRTVAGGRISLHPLTRLWRNGSDLRGTLSGPADPRLARQIYLLLLYPSNPTVYHCSRIVGAYERLSTTKCGYL